MINKTNEIDELIEKIRENCPDVVVSQLTVEGEKPYISGAWRFWLKGNEEIRITVEVQHGMLYALYASGEFEDKYPIEASKICNFLKTGKND